MTPPAIARWHAIAASGDVAALGELLAPDAVFHSPVVFSPQTGPAVAAYLGAAIRVLGGSLKYGEQWHGTSSSVLEFTAELDGVHVNGVDIIRWNADDRIVAFKVMARPLKGINALREKMAAALL